MPRRGPGMGSRGSRQVRRARERGTAARACDYRVMRFYVFLVGTGRRAGTRVRADDPCCALLTPTCAQFTQQLRPFPRPLRPPPLRRKSPAPPPPAACPRQAARLSWCHLGLTRRSLRAGHSPPAWRGRRASSSARCASRSSRAPPRPGGGSRERRAAGGPPRAIFRILLKNADPSRSKKTQIERI